MSRSASGAGVLCAVASTLAPGVAQAVPPSGYTLTWSEEFTQKVGTPPQAARWNYDLGASGWGNNESQEYVQNTQHARVIADPAATDGKALEIRATRDAEGKYRSARIHTRDKFTTRYGYIEARIRLPYGQGIWPAFWMLGNDINAVGWPKCGEIDIMEHLGSEPSLAHGTLHGPGYSGASGITSSYTLPDGKRFKEGYHTFAVHWRPKAITFYVDGVAYKTRTPADLPAGAEWVYDKPFFVILNLAIGGNWPGYPDSTTTFPQSLRVDYVRVYSEKTASR